MTTETPTKIEKKTFDLMALSTLAFVLAFLVGEVWAVATQAIEIDRFLKDVGGPALVMLAFWRGGK